MFLSRFLKDPQASQLSVLRSILGAASQTVWGREYDLAGLAADRDDRRLVDRYQSRVPLLEYENMRPFVERMRAGETDQAITVADAEASQG